jgi:hypothetical protein
MSGNYEHSDVLYKINPIVDIMKKLKKKVCDILAVDKWVISLKGLFFLTVIPRKATQEDWRHGKLLAATVHACLKYKILSGGGGEKRN